MVRVVMKGPYSALTVRPNFPARWQTPRINTQPMDFEDARLFFCAIQDIFSNLSLGQKEYLSPVLANALNESVQWNPFNTSTALISVIGLGIAVDDTIHFLTEYNLRRAEKMPIWETLRRVTMDKGLGICSSSVILFIGFSVLMLSNFVPTMSFGFLSAVIMITAWIGDMIVLPAVVLSFCRKKT